MTIYEIIATVLAVLAFIQPWAIWVYKKVSKKIEVSFLPSERIKLFYNKSGAYINMGGVIESKNQDCVVKNITAKVVRQNDNAELNLEWSSFLSPVYQSIAGTPVLTNETARPFKVKANELIPVFIEFANSNEKIMSRQTEIFNNIANQSKNIITFPNYENALNHLKKLKEYENYSSELLENFFWKECEYIVEFNIVYNDNKNLQYKYSFALDTEEITKLKSNIEKSLTYEITRFYGQNVYFEYSQKEYKPIK